MRSMTKQTLIIFALSISGMTTNLLANEVVLNERIDRLERIIQGQGLVTLLGRVDQLQSQVQKLYGENESLRHELSVMEKRQRELYLDIDKRLETQKLEITKIISAQTSSDVASPQQHDDVDSALTEKESTPSAPVAVESGEAAYQSALQILRSGQYEQAITALKAFPEQYPHSRYLPNTYYWQGEANYVLRHFNEAITAFEVVINKYPASTKMADATLKLGFSQYELGQFAAAKTTLNQVIELYPDTSAARLAKVRLDRINKQAQ